MGGRDFWTGFTKSSAESKKPRFEEQRPNEAIVTIEQCLKENGANAEVMAAFEELRAAADTPSPLYQMMVERFKAGRGLTQYEISLVSAYLNFRAIPTLFEIIACEAALVKAGKYKDAIELFPNLKDELAGNHMTLLFLCMNQCATELGAECLDPRSYQLATQALIYQEKHGRLPTAEELKQQNTKSLVDDLPSRYSFAESIAKALAMAALLPPDAHQYGQQIEALADDESWRLSDDVKLTRYVCAPALRLAIRESSSAQQSGVVGLWKTLTDEYRGYFYDKPYYKIDTYARIHIGDGDGVEDQHKAQANGMAKGYVMKLLKQDPQALIEVFRQEAALCRLRTQQARSFVTAMKKSRDLPAEAPKPSGELTPVFDFSPEANTMRHLVPALNPATGEIPPKPEPTPEKQQKRDLRAQRLYYGLWTTATALANPGSTIEDLLFGDHDHKSRRSPSR